MNDPGMVRLRRVLGHAPGYMAGRADRPTIDRGVNLIILGVILIIVGVLLNISIITTIGIILAVVGLILTILGAVGRGVGGRKTYF